MKIPFKFQISNLKLKSFVTVLVLVGMGVVAFLWITTQAKAAWYDDTYSYRLRFSFVHNAAITSERSITLTLDTAELITDNLMQSDCDDIRFTDGSGKALLFDLTGTCNNASTTIEVIFPSIIDGTNVGFVYYGNPGASNAEISSTPYTDLTPSGGAPSNSNPTASDEQGTAPVSYWDFDEGTSTTASDYSRTFINNLTITGAAWRDPSLCFSDKCLFFDGNADRASKAYASDTELLPGTAGFTVSTWFKHNSYADADILISRIDGVNGVGWKIYMNNSGNMCFGIDDTAGTFPADSACSSATYADTQWHHLVAVKNGTSNIRIYIDGSQVGEDATLASTGSLNGANSGFRVGNDANDSTTGWFGFIDEVKYYNFAKSASDIKNEYSARLGGKSASANLGQDFPANSLSNGLVGQWKMDEPSANSCTGGVNDNCDSSGNLRDGAYNGNAGTATYGKYGLGTSLDGTGDYLEIPDFDL